MRGITPKIKTPTTIPKITTRKRKTTISLVVHLDTDTVDTKVEIMHKAQKVASLNTRRKKKRKRKKRRKKRSFRKSVASTYSLRSTSPSANLRLSALLGKQLKIRLSFNRPSSAETEEIVKLFDAGMSCARINLSHGSTKVNNLNNYS